MMKLSAKKQAAAAAFVCNKNGVSGWIDLNNNNKYEPADENPLVRCVEVPACDHFELLVPANRILAERLFAQPDLGRVTIRAGEIQKGILEGRAAAVEANDLFALSNAREARFDLNEEQQLRFAIRSWDRDVHRQVVGAIGRVAKALDLKVGAPATGVDSDGDDYQEVVLFGTLRPLPDLERLFRISKQLEAAADEQDAAYWHWTIR